jgi:hypothetical protein
MIAPTLPAATQVDTLPPDHPDDGSQTAEPADDFLVALLLQAGQLAAGGAEPPVVDGAGAPAVGRGSDPVPSVDAPAAAVTAPPGSPPAGAGGALTRAPGSPAPGAAGTVSPPRGLDIPEPAAPAAQASPPPTVSGASAVEPSRPAVPPLVPSGDRGVHVTAAPHARGAARPAADTLLQARAAPPTLDPAPPPAPSSASPSAERAEPERALTGPEPSASPPPGRAEAWRVGEPAMPGPRTVTRADTEPAAPVVASRSSPIATEKVDRADELATPSLSPPPGDPDLERDAARSSSARHGDVSPPVPPTPRTERADAGRVSPRAATSASPVSPPTERVEPDGVLPPASMPPTERVDLEGVLPTASVPPTERVEPESIPPPASGAPAAAASPAARVEGGRVDPRLASPPSPSAGRGEGLSELVAPAFGSAPPSMTPTDFQRGDATIPPPVAPAVVPPVAPAAPRIAAGAWDLAAATARAAAVEISDGDHAPPRADTGGQTSALRPLDALHGLDGGAWWSDPRIADAAVGTSDRGPAVVPLRRGPTSAPAGDPRADDGRIDGADRRRPDAPLDAAPLAVTGPHTRAASADTTAGSETPAARPVVEQVAAHVATIRREGRQELSFTLDPPALGRVRIEAVLEGRHLTLHIRTEAERSREMLQQDLPRLQETLAQQGFVADRVSIDVDLGAGGRYPAANDFTAFARPERPDARSPLPRPPAAAIPRPGPVEGFDIWV